MLSCRSHYRAGFYREGSVFPDAQGGREGFKMESKAHGGGAMRAADEDAGAMGFVAGMAHVSQGVPSGDGGGDGPGNPTGTGDTVSPTVPGNPGNPGDPRGPSTAGKSRGAASDILQILGSLHAPGCGRDTAPGAGVPSNGPLQLCPIPGGSVAGVGVWTRGGLGDCSRRGPKV